jgi:hypothetical protein
LKWRLTKSKAKSGRAINLSPNRRPAFAFAIGGELSATSVPETFRRCIAEILLHSNYEGTDLEELSRDVGFRPVDETDVGKLAREVDLLGARDNDLVPDQKEHSDDALAV